MKSFEQLRWGLFTGIILCLLLLLRPGQAQAQWPPFTFKLTPVYDQGRITYNLRFSREPEFEGHMTNVRINVPVPEGTRFVEGHSATFTTVNFDGKEVSFFTAGFPGRSIPNMSFTVEVTDQAKKVFATHAWIAWEGDHPGNFLTDEFESDITKPLLNWQSPPASRLELGVTAEVEDDVVTYSIYTRNVSSVRMWDLHVTFPIPAGATFLSVEAPSEYSSGQTDQQVVFSAIELAKEVDLPPLKVKVSTTGLADTPLQTQVWASWKNAGRRVGTTIPTEETTETGEIIVQPRSGQQVVADQAGDVPLASYDLTSIAFQEVILPETDQTALKMVLYTVGNVRLDAKAMSYYVYIDQDCNTETGQPRSFLGAEYMVRYQHHNGKAEIRSWQAADTKWTKTASVLVDAPDTGNSITLWIPSRLLSNPADFCWRAQARVNLNTTPGPPSDYLLQDGNIHMYSNHQTAQPPITETNLPAEE
jgi:hypothetical protein